MERWNSVASEITPLDFDVIEASLAMSAMGRDDKEAGLSSLERETVREMCFKRKASIREADFCWSQYAEAYAKSTDYSMELA